MTATFNLIYLADYNPNDPANKHDGLVTRICNSLQCPPTSEQYLYALDKAGVPHFKLCVTASAEKQRTANVALQVLIDRDAEKNDYAFFWHGNCIF